MVETLKQSPDVRRVFVTGLRATTGRPLAELLARRPGVEVLGGTRDPSSSGVPRLPGVRTVAFSWDDPAGWSEVLDGVDAVFVVRPDREDAPELVARLVERTGEDAHVVLVSEFDPGYFDEDDWAPRVERAVRRGGRAWTILRPGWFMQVLTDERFFLSDVVESGRLPFPSAGRPVAWIDARDIAAVAAAVMLERDGHEHRVYELSGPEPVGLERTAALVGAAIGRRVAHVEPTLEEALEGRSGFARANDEGAFVRVRLGMAATVTNVVELVTGRRAHTLEEFLATWARDRAAMPV